MAEAFRLSQFMIQPALMATRPVGMQPAPVVAPVAVAYSPPEPKDDPPYTLIAAGVVALLVGGLVVYKLKFRKKRSNPARRRSVRVRGKGTSKRKPAGPHWRRVPKRERLDCNSPFHGMYWTRN